MAACFPLVQPGNVNHLISSKAWPCASPKAPLSDGGAQAWSPGTTLTLSALMRCQCWGMGKGKINSEQGDLEIPAEGGIGTWP